MAFFGAIEALARVDRAGEQFEAWELSASGPIAVSEPLRPFTFRIVLAGAASAFGLTALAATLPETQRLDDIQIGEAGAVVRVALLCRGVCDVVPSVDKASIGSFVLRGVSQTLDIDLSGRGGLAERLRLKPIDGGSLLTIEADAGLNSARVIDCKTESGPARCVEFRFDRAGARTVLAPPAAAPPADLAPRPKPGRRPALSPATVSNPPPETPAPSPGLRGERALVKPADDIPFIGAIVLDQKSPLREGAQDRLVVPGFAPPERLAPPRAAPDLAATLKERVSAPPKEPGRAFSIAAEMAAILNKTADPGTCEGAAARLSADAWALDAMVDLAFCKAAAGRIEDADADFARLLAYTPDNHEALVGRGLIALARGERSRGLDFLQEALNALPPIAESDRIADAMARY